MKATYTVAVVDDLIRHLVPSDPNADRERGSIIRPGHILLPTCPCKPSQYSEALWVWLHHDYN